MSRVEIVSGVERRRRWSDEAKLEILAEADRPGARIGDVARRHDIFPAQIRTWRQKFLAPDPLTSFVPVRVLDREVGELCGTRRVSAPSATTSSMIEISLRNGRSLKAAADIDRRMLSSVSGWQELRINGGA
jgi:transposase